MPPAPVGPWQTAHIDAYNDSPVGGVPPSVPSLDVTELFPEDGSALVDGLTAPDEVDAPLCDVPSELTDPANDELRTTPVRDDVVDVPPDVDPPAVPPPGEQPVTTRIPATRSWERTACMRGLPLRGASYRDVSKDASPGAPDGRRMGWRGSGGANRGGACGWHFRRRSSCI